MKKLTVDDFVKNKFIDGRQRVHWVANVHGGPKIWLTDDAQFRPILDRINLITAVPTMAEAVEIINKAMQYEVKLNMLNIGKWLSTENPSDSIAIGSDGTFTVFCGVMKHDGIATFQEAKRLLSELVIGREFLATASKETTPQGN